jgi:hypothetical protein
MTDAPKRIWARRHPTGVVEAADYKIEGEQEYYRADLSADLVQAGYLAGLKDASMVAAEWEETWDKRDNEEASKGAGLVFRDTRTLIADPEAIAAIAARVTEGK